VRIQDATTIHTFYVGTPPNYLLVSIKLQRQTPDSRRIGLLRRINVISPSVQRNGDTKYQTAGWLTLFELLWQSQNHRARVITKLGEVGLKYLN
jgi:hypothetical protein